MSETLDELKAIIYNAPDGATHFGIDFIYYKYEKADSVAIWREYTQRKSTFVLNQCICMMNLRSLSDIKRIIELMESNSKLQNKSGESFKEELLKATSSMMHPHIEGVYAVWEDQL